MRTTTRLLAPLLAPLALITLGTASLPAVAAVPFFNATCPHGLAVHADEGGPVYVNGRETRLQRFNENYYEAKDQASGTMISISPTAAGIQVSYTGRGRANGVCTVASAPASAEATRPSPPAPQSSAQVIRLQCPGEGSVPTVSSDNVSEYNKDTHKFESHAETRSGTSRTRGTVELELTPGPDGYQGRIRLPQALVPPLHSGGSDGWWTLSDVHANGDVVNAKFQLNRFNHPALRLDRRTGDVAFKGLSEFTGMCTLSAAQRLF